MVNEEKREFGAWWIWVLLLVVISIGVLTLTGAAGKIFGTAVEREVFEQSYQYTAGQKAKIAEFSAQLAEIDRQLAGSLDENTRQNLEAQAAAIRIQLAVAKATQE